VTAASVATAVVESSSQVVAPEATPVTIGGLISSVVHPLLSFFGLGPGGLADSPLAWIGLAAVRRPVQPVAAVSAATVAATNEPPTVRVVWGRPDATTGAVVGKLTTRDAEGKKVTVALGQAPDAGTLTYNAKTATLTYTPTTAQRFAAAQTPDADTVTMTLKLSDGVNKPVVAVDIPVSPSPYYKSGDISVSAPSAVATAGTRAYIASRDTGLVTVYDTVKNTVVATYQVGGAPDGIVVKSDGSKIFVSSSTANTVTMITTKTAAVAAPLAVVNPTTMTISPNGSALYVANGATGTVTVISTSTNKVSRTVTLAAGLHPTALMVSADSKKIYVASETAAGGNISVFSSTAKTATSLTQLDGAPISFALDQPYRMLFALDGSGGLTMIGTANNSVNTFTGFVGQPLNGIAVSKDGSTVLLSLATGQLAAVSPAGQVLGVAGIGDPAADITAKPGMVVSADGTQMLMTDQANGVVHIVSLVPPNTAPMSNDPSYGIGIPATGALFGELGVVDFDGDPLTYVVTTKPTKGKLVLGTGGTYTYTPTAAARHAAAVSGAPESATTDSFTVTVSDGRYGTLVQTITVTIPPANKTPVVTVKNGNPSATTGVVKGSITATDGDKDKRTYTVFEGPAKGMLTLTSTGAYTYTPDPVARTAALAPGATHDDKMDTFVVTVDDDHGGVIPITVNVKIGTANVKPTGTKATVAELNPRSGVVTGTLTATDVDGDTLTYTAGKTTKGSIVINSDGSFTYTPTAAARLAASKPGASAASKTETVSITVTDRFGGTTTTSVKIAIAPNPKVNAAPTDGVSTVQSTSTAIGTVTGIVTATDPDGDVLTYSLGTGPVSGQATVSADGRFSYTPDVDARYLALVNPAAGNDSFTVNISDGFGGISTATVHVTIAPPSDSPSAIDQRATTVGITTQQMFFYSQTDTDKAMAVLKGAGVDTIRIMLPWGVVESTDDSYDWSAVDRMVTSANANGVKVLAVINATPDWAAVPGQPQYVGYPTDVAAFGDFVTEVAARYQGRITDYEIWNEQNYNGFWSPAPNAADYTALLKAAYTAIKEADPDAVVIAGGIAAVLQTPGGPAINPVTYLSQMYAAGAAGYFDAIAFHPYMYSVPFSAGQGHDGLPIMQAQQMYELMKSNGDANKKIWVTEYGEPAANVGEAAQADYIGDFLRTWRTLEFAGPAFIHTLRDYDAGDPTESSFGVLNEDWTPKPAFGTIAENAAINAAGKDL